MKIRGNTVGTTLKPEQAVVRCKNLTEEQKAQARENIDAADVSGNWHASYKITGSKKISKWVRVLNLSRVINGTLNLNLFQGNPCYMAQNVSLDVSGYVRWEGDTQTAKPVIVQNHNNIYGVDSVTADPLKQARITKVRLAYPKRDADYGKDGNFPVPDAEGDYQSINNPVYCYLDALIEVDRNYTEGASSPAISVSYNGMSASKCVPITEQTVVDDTTLGRYGEQLDFCEFELNTDIDFYMPDRKMQVKEIKAENLEKMDENLESMEAVLQKQMQQIQKLNEALAVLANPPQYELIEKITLNTEEASIDRRGYNLSALRVYIDTPAADYTAKIVIDIRNKGNARTARSTLGNIISSVAGYSFYTLYNDHGMVAHSTREPGGNLVMSTDGEKPWDNVYRVYLTAVEAKFPKGSVISIYGVKE